MLVLVVVASARPVLCTLSGNSPNKRFDGSVSDTTDPHGSLGPTSKFLDGLQAPFQ